MISRLKIVTALTFVSTLVIITIILGVRSSVTKDSKSEIKQATTSSSSIHFEEKKATEKHAKNNSPLMVYDQWTTYTMKNGLPSNKAFCIKADHNRLLAGTDAGLAVFEDGQWKTYTEADGLAHRVVLSIDIAPATGDVWIATMGGLSRLSAGIFTTYTQFNSGLPNDVVYQVTCDNKDVWVATGGGAGQYNTYTEQWSIYTEQNAPMHEPWTYGISAHDGQVYIAAWGGGVIEYNTRTHQFRDHRDPDGEMEIDLFPDDGLVHDITTGVSYANNTLWVGTYFGLSRYDGTHWQGFFDHDSGLSSNFINYLKAFGDQVWICTDNGLNNFDGTTWITYQKATQENTGKIILQEEKQTLNKITDSGIALNFVGGMDMQGDVVWLATSNGISKGVARKSKDQWKDEL